MKKPAKENLAREIESLRHKLHSLVQNNNVEHSDLSNSEILSLSTELDKLIILYMKNKEESL